MSFHFRSQAIWALTSSIVLMVLMSLTTDTFATAQNLFNIVRNASFIAIMALGMMPVLIAGGIDLSIGSIIGLSAIVTGMVLQAGASLFSGVAAGLGAAMLCGLFNGLLIAYARFAPFIVTIATMSAVRSLDLVVSNGKAFSEFGSTGVVFSHLGGGGLYGAPIPGLICLTVMGALAFALRNLRWGRYVYALGGNERALTAAGVSSARVKLSVYLISGFCAGLAALLMTGWLGGVTPNLGSGYELNVIAAAVIGGVSLAGGYGTVVGPVAGALLLEVIRNAFLLAGFNSYWQGIFVGAIIICGLVFERLRRK